LRSGFVVSAVLILLIALVSISTVPIISNVLAQPPSPPPPPPQRPPHQGEVAVVVQLVQVNIVVQVTLQVTEVIPTGASITLPNEEANLGDISFPSGTPISLPPSTREVVGLLTGSIAMLAAAAYLTFEGINRINQPPPPPHPPSPDISWNPMTWTPSNLAEGLSDEVGLPEEVGDVLESGADADKLIPEIEKHVPATRGLNGDGLVADLNNQKKKRKKADF
jgi:hypothetical protein